MQRPRLHNVNSWKHVPTLAINIFIGFGIRYLSFNKNKETRRLGKEMLCKHEKYMWTHKSFFPEPITFIFTYSYSALRKYVQCWLHFKIRWQTRMHIIQLYVKCDPFHNQIQLWELFQNPWRSDLTSALCSNLLTANVLLPIRKTKRLGWKQPSSSIPERHMFRNSGDRLISWSEIWVKGVVFFLSLNARFLKIMHLKWVNSWFYF